MMGTITGLAERMSQPAPSGRPSFPPLPSSLNPGIPTATIHFLVHPSMPEVAQLAREARWLEAGFSVLSVSWLELHYTTDGWMTSRVLKSTDVPCPVIHGWFYLHHVRLGDEVEFAVQAGIGCRAPEDRAGFRAQLALWFNNRGANYRQVAR